VPSQASSPIQSERQAGAPDDQREDLAVATDNPKRVVGLSASTGWAATPTLNRMLTYLETKTVWHPVAMQAAGVKKYKYTGHCPVLAFAVPGDRRRRFPPPPIRRSRTVDCR
jgi:hypothetical protein